VILYATADCTGSPVASITVAAFASGVFVTASPNATTNYSANALDVAGNTSDCSAPVTFVHDSIAPAPPSSLSVSPASPSQSTIATVSGTPEAGSTVKLYASTTCNGSPVATDTASNFASGLSATPSANATTSYSATATDAAGNTSDCSPPVSFTHDSNAPPAPAAIAIDQKSPSTSAALKVSGQAEAGSAIELYDNASCTGTPAATGSAADFAAGFPVTAAGNMNVYAATATDIAGNTSPCSNAAGFQLLKRGRFVKPKFKTKRKGSRVTFSATLRLSGAGITQASCVGTVKAVLKRGRDNKAFPSAAPKNGVAKLSWTGRSCVAKISVSKSAGYTTKGVTFKTTLSVSSPSLAVPAMVIVKKF
jgi:hypothetical protein